MNPRRVVVTGIGAVTPIGTGAEGLWEGVRCGRSGVRTITRFDTSQISTTVAAEIDDFNPLDYFESKIAGRMDRFAHLALASADLALHDAGVTLSPSELHERIGVTIGTALGGVAGAEMQHERYLQYGLKAVDPSLALIVFGGSGSSNIAIRYGLAGPSNANCNSCTSGAIAIGEAYRYIRDGYADVMLSAGAEAPLYELTFSAFSIIRAMSRNPDPATACRPFDLRRDGFVMGEGAAVLVLEEIEHAVKRGASIYCEVQGYACNNDAHHMVAPRPGGECIVRVMREALREAQLEPAQVDYVNAHGSSTVLNDKTETAALKQVFGTHVARIPVSATKSMHGHALGASGAIEAAIVALAFRKNFLPPTIHLSTPDPECDLDYVPNEGRETKLKYVLSNSFGFGGINASLVFGKYDE